MTGPVSRSLSFFVPGIPISQGSKRAFVIKDKSGRHRPVLTESAKGLPQWRATVALAGRRVMIANNQLMSRWEKSALSVSLTFYIKRPKSLPKREHYPIKRPDVDKLARAVLDALTSIVWVDDAQITNLRAIKEYAEDGEVGVCVDVAAHGHASGV